MTKTDFDLLRSLGPSYLIGPAFFGTALQQTGQVNFFNASSQHATTFQAGNATSAATYTLPVAAPASASSLLQSTTTGTLSWVNSFTFAAGSAAAPSINFSGATTTGLFSTGGPGIGFSVSGVERGSFTASRFITYNQLSVGGRPNTSLSLAETTGGSLTPSTLYYYKLFPISANDMSLWPSAETTITLSGTGTRVNATWSTVPGAAKYRLTRSTQQGAQAGWYETTGTSYSDTGAAFDGLFNALTPVTMQDVAYIAGVLWLPSSSGGVNWIDYTNNGLGGGIGHSSSGEMTFIVGEGAGTGNYYFFDKDENQKIRIETASSTPSIDFYNGASLGTGVLVGATINVQINSSRVASFTSTGLTLDPTSNQLVLGTTRTVTLNAPTPATTSRAWTVPDISADGTFASLTGTQTFSGAKTFSSTLTMSGATIAMGSQKITGLAAGTTTGDALRYEQLFGGDVTLAGNLIFNPTTKGVKGTTTNDNPEAGNVGEVISAANTSYTNFPTSGQYGDLTSISLTAGDWLLSVQIGAIANGATVTVALVGFSTTSGNSNTGLNDGDTLLNIVPPTSSINSSGSLAFKRVNLSGTTTHYLKYFANYSAATPQAVGRITAVRIR